MTDLKADLAAFVQAMPVDADDIHRSKPWFVSRRVPTTDFNREFCTPGIAPRFPDGALGIRTDDDFWEVALLPWRFSALSIQDLVAVLWPQYAGEAEYNPDSHYNPKHAAAADEDLE